MTVMPLDQDPAWHQALAFAITGQYAAGLGRQSQPDLAILASILREHIAIDEPLGPSYPVPPELRSGIGAAQFVAALSQLRRLLGSTGTVAPVVANRPLTADERRLLSDVPPHHGS
jgi:hypothetical protein